MSSTSQDLGDSFKCIVTGLVTMEDLFISPEGGAITDILDGFYDAAITSGATGARFYLRTRQRSGD